MLLNSGGMATQSNHFEEGIKLYQKKKFDESKIFFERDIVFNPKSEKSYLYLAKIFNENNNDEQQEINLSNVEREKLRSLEKTSLCKNLNIW